MNSEIWLTEEDALLVDCIRSHQGNFTLNPDVKADWTGVADRALALGVAPLVYHRLKATPSIAHDRLSGETWERLRQAYLHCAARNTLLHGELTRILRAFAADGIDVIVLKGAALSEGLYLNIALRPMGDLDLLVRAEDVSPAEGTLARIGYQAEVPPPGLRVLERIPHEATFVPVQSRSGVAVDLHWHLLGNSQASIGYRVDMDGLWERAGLMEFEGVPAFRLAPEDELLHLCLHQGVHHLFSHLRGHIDVNWLIASCGDKMDWEAFINRAFQFRASIVTYYALLLNQRLLGTQVPQKVLDALRPRRHWSFMVVRTRYRAGALPLRGLLSPFDDQGHVARLLLIDRWTDVLMTLFRLLVPTRGWLRSRYDTEGRLPFYAYYLVHLLRLMRHGGPILTRFLWRSLTGTIA